VQGKKVTFLVDYFDQRGKRHNKTFAREKDAKEWRDRTAVEIKDGIHTPPADSITEPVNSGWRKAEPNGSNTGR
jgi:hypothetical protein